MLGSVEAVVQPQLNELAKARLELPVLAQRRQIETEAQTLAECQDVHWIHDSM